MDKATYDRGFAAMLDVFEGMIAESEAEDSPEKWDEEYAQHAVDDVLDRMICAGPRRPSDELRERYRSLRRRASPYMDEDVDLPATQGDYERGAEAMRALVAMHEVKLPDEYRANREAVVAVERLIEEINCMKSPVRTAVIASFAGVPAERIKDAELSSRVDDDGVMQVAVNMKMRPSLDTVHFATTIPGAGVDAVVARC